MKKVSSSTKPKPDKFSKIKKLSKNKDKLELKLHNFKHKKLKNASNYFADPSIIPRVEDYLEEHEDKEHIDVDEMVDDLRSRHKEYARKKRGPFKSVVEKAFAKVLKRYGQSNTANCSISDESEEVDDPADGFEEDFDEEDELLEDDEDDDEEMSGFEDELDEEEEEYLEMMNQKSNRSKHSESNMYGGEKKSTQRNGAQELINISSDESEKECPTKSVPTKTKSTPSKAPVIATRHPSSPKFGSQSISSCNNNTNNIANNHNSNINNNKNPTVNISQAQQAILAKNKSFATTIARFQQTSANSHALEFPIKTRTCVKFSDVGGCSKILKELSQFLLHLRHPEVYQYLGVVPPRGFLLHGPPGTGKTLLARAIAGELKLPLIQVAAPELIKGVSGGSEERIRHLFEQAVSIAPCILFLDEVDAITPRRDNAQREMERRIVAQLLSSLDELTTTLNGNKVLVIGATNRPDAIDPALRRAGRFDREISLGIPDRDARKEILRLVTAKLRVAPDVSLDNIAANTPGYVGADLRALVTEAALAAVERLFGDKSEDGENKANVPFVQNDNETSTKDEEMKDVSSAGPAKEINDNENIIDKTFHSGGGEPKPKTRKLDTESGVSKDVENLPSDRGETETPKTDQNVEEENKDTESNVNEKNDKEQKESVLNNEGKKVEEDVIDVEDEESESNKNEAKVEETVQIRISELLHDVKPLTVKQLKCLVVEECDFKIALRVVQPSAKREGFATVPDVTWNDIGSLKHIHDELQMMIMAPVRYSSAFSMLGLRTSSGVLLCGPPGCGKTLVAKAVANEADINFISVKGPELLNMYVGESERAVRQCFMRARNSQPCVIFFDELDAICPKRSDVGESGASSRVVNQLLTEMDGVEGRHGVFVMAATNRPDIIDPAVLRPGRLDKILFIGLPSPADRVEILKALTKNGTRPVLSEDVSLEALGHSEMCNNFTGADLSSLVQEAGVVALMEYMQNSGIGPIKVAAKHFSTAFHKIRPSVSEQDLKHYEKLRTKYASVQQIVNGMEITEENSGSYF